jgi:hypothetical protein
MMVLFLKSSSQQVKGSVAELRVKTPSINETGAASWEVKTSEESSAAAYTFPDERSIISILSPFLAEMDCSGKLLYSPDQESVLV